VIEPGVYNIMATPFDDDGALDLESLRRLVDVQLAAGAAGLVILGIMGEAHKLTDGERLAVMRAALAHAAGRCPVIAGISAAGPDASIMLGREAARLGAAGVMLMPPTNLRNLDSVFACYRAVADALSLPIVVQDEPVQSGVVMPVSFLARLCDEIERCAAIKLEDAPTPPKISALRAQLRREVPIFGGLGGAQFYYELRRGAAGTMTGFAYTEALVAIHARHAAGDDAGARALYERYLPLLTYEAQPGIGLALRKELLRRRGAIATAAVRQPAMRLDAAAHAELDELLAGLDVGEGPPRT
jgi:4-hydroxy-tetrahydrodipicolinate synthase